jgi:hypothetical protein
MRVLQPLVTALRKERGKGNTCAHAYEEDSVRGREKEQKDRVSE